MKAKAKETSSARETQFELKFELKYCERCGGLWLRPVGGEQIYCKACGSQMAEMPPASYEPERLKKARMPCGPLWGADNGGFEGDDEDEEPDLNAAGGAA